jgi:hypothetical protein
LPVEVEAPEGTGVLTEEPTSGTDGSQWFRPALALVVLGGLAARLAFVTTARFPALGLNSDAVFYRDTATRLADGMGYSDRSPTVANHFMATAFHPPLFTGLLAFFDLLGIQSVPAQRLALGVVGTLAVLVMGLLGRKVGGPVVGIVAAAIAAFDPLWFQPVGSILSESIYLIVVPLILLQALRCLEQATARRFAVLGILLAGAVLIRSDAAGFILFLGLPLLLFVAVPWRTRALLGVALLAGLIVILGPWLIRNEIQLGATVLSDQQGVTLVGSYCSDTFDPASPTYGAFSGECAEGAVVALLGTKPPDGARQWTEVSIDRELTHAAEQFARSHLGALPRVVLAREASAWGLGDHSYQLVMANAEGRNTSYEQAGWVVYWVMVPFVIIGMVVLARRSWKQLVLIVAPMVVVAVNVALVYGSTRLRVAAEPSLAVLAAMGGVAVAHRIRLATAAVDHLHRTQSR